MSKIYKQPVTMQLGPGGQPFSFSWKGKWHLIERCYPVEVQFRDHQFYRSIGRDPYADCYRCVTDDGIDCDLVKEKGSWLIERVWD
ncbi:hypothetical protein [Desulforamulus aeronauticus]|uniref:Uncharacterized protein n=1 Tax=Desulforamulus aeronauticus DSM 10349 TaxID=1121421 RepID=A0A1M6VCC5_9FIRM|nr:hypothetical protein [Desulforamulus aeronauticus]SHK78936.1 hypothetical protein SAMN02745123_03121 [Desulforamulus aeronauticus DSM 10349]